MMELVAIWFVAIISMIIAVKRSEKESTPLTKAMYERNHKYNH